MKSPLHESLISGAGREYTYILESSSPRQPTLKKTVKRGFDTGIDTEGCKRTVVYPSNNEDRGSERSCSFQMDTANFANAPTAEHEGTYTVHQTITCHYTVYAPTTVHVNPEPNRPRVTTETSSAASAKSSSRTVVSRVSCEPSVGKLDLEAETTTRPEGKRQAILQWLILKFVLLLGKVSH